jgi:hypothetical protein
MNQFEIMAWAQMFFDDGSVSEGKRVGADVVEDKVKMRMIALDFLKDLNREEGLLLIWGAGELVQRYYKISISLVLAESDFSASEPSLVFVPEHTTPELL